MAQHRVPSGIDPIDFLLRENANLANRVQALEGRRLSTWDRNDHTSVAAPTEGQHHVEPTTESVWYYSNGVWRSLSKAVLHIKVFSDTQTVTTGDGKFIFEVSEDMDGMNLVDVETYVTTVSSSGLPTVQIRNVTQTADMLTTKVSIDASEKNSKDAATSAVIDTGNDDVAWGDHIAIDQDVAGTGAKGEGVILTFA